MRETAETNNRLRAESQKQNRQGGRNDDSKWCGLGERSAVVPGFEFDEKADLEQSPAWFLDGTHSVPPWTPLFGWFWINFCRHGMQYGAEKLSLPTVKGWDWRFKNGGGYLTLLLVKSEEEQRQREERFREAIRPFVENYDGLWQSQLDEILALYEI